jgi:serine protease AprX
VIGSAVVHPDATTPTDGYGHGTHVAGIIAGDSLNRPPGDPLRGRYGGVAPDANLISIKASDDEGNSTVLDVIAGIQFAVDHKLTYNTRVLNLSLESTVAESYRTDPLDAAVEAAWFKGIVVVAAAANRGTGTDAVRYAPGNDPYVITVGAVDDQGTKSVTDDRLAPRSSRGTTHDGIAKPELVAPGAKIVSTLAPASAFTALCPTCAVDGEYIRAGGTSMPCPTRDAARRVKTCSALSAKRGRRR